MMEAPNGPIVGLRLGHSTVDLAATVGLMADFGLSEPAVVGTPKSAMRFKLMVPAREFYAGNDLLRVRGLCTLHRPIHSGGNVAEWERANLLLSHLIWVSRLEEHASDLAGANLTVVVVEAPITTATGREALAQMVFRVLHRSSRVIFVSEPEAVARAVGLPTCVVVSIGTHQTTTSCVLQGRLLCASVQQSLVGAETAVSVMWHLMLHMGITFLMSVELDMLRSFFSDACFAAESRDIFRSLCEDFPAALAWEYCHPSAPLQFSLGTERIWAPEVLFDPAAVASQVETLQSTSPKHCEKGVFPPRSLAAIPSSGSDAAEVRPIQQLVVDSMTGGAPVDAHEELLRNVVVHGGMAQMKGVAQRLGRELAALTGFDPAGVRPVVRQSLWCGESCVSAGSGTSAAHLRSLASDASHFLIHER